MGARSRRWQGEVLERRFVVVLGQQRCDFLPQQAVEFGSTHIFVLCHTRLKPLYDLERGLDADIRRYENLLKLVEEIVIDTAAACNGTRDLGEHTLLGTFQPFIQGLFFLFREEFEEAHKLVLLFLLQIYKN